MFVFNSFIMGKFTKEQALEELKKQIPGKGEKLNLSERSISEQLETLMPLLATDDTELSDFINKVLPIFKTADANVRNDVSVGIKDYKDKNPVQTPQPNQPKPDTDVKDEAMAAALKRIEELERKNAENEALALRNKRRSDIISKMSDKGCKDKEWVSNLLDEVNLDGEDFDANAREEKYLKMYNKSKANSPNSVTPLDTTGRTEVDKALKDTIAAAGRFVQSQSLQQQTSEN